MRRHVARVIPVREVLQNLPRAHDVTRRHPNLRSSLRQNRVTLLPRPFTLLLRP